MPQNLVPFLKRIAAARQTPGLLLFQLRTSYTLVASNPSADGILERVDAMRSVDRVFQKVLEGRGRAKEIRALISSGRRTYVLRGFPVASRNGGCFYAVLLERINPHRLDFGLARQRYKLSPREIEIVNFLRNGLRDKEMAETMGLSPATVRSYLKALRAKLGVSTRTAIVQKLHSML